jgi:hypothetical protein
VDSVRAVAAKHGVKLEAPRSAKLSRIREEIDGAGSSKANAIRRESFEEFGEHGDVESLQVFPLENVPAQLGQLLPGIAISPTNVAQTLFSWDTPAEYGEEWFLLERSDNGETLTMLRRFVYHRDVTDPVTGQSQPERRTEDREIDLRLDRQRSALLVSNATPRDAKRLVRAVIVFAVGRGIQLNTTTLPTLNAAVLHALVDSFDGRPAMTDVAPTDTELLPWKKIGTRQVDLRKHRTIASMIEQGEQTSLTGTFSREKLRGSNNCPALVTVEVRADWTIIPRTYIEPEMLFALYDRLVDLYRFARLLTPIGRAVQLRLLQKLGARLTTARTDKAIAGVRRKLPDLGLADRPQGASAQELYDTVVLNLILWISDCGKVALTPTSAAVKKSALDAILDELVPSAGDPERVRVRHSLSQLVEKSSDYLDLAKRGEKALVAAGC